MESSEQLPATKVFFIKIGLMLLEWINVILKFFGVILMPIEFERIIKNFSEEVC